MANTVLKSLETNAYTRVPFKTYSTQTHVVVSGSTDNTDKVTINYGQKFTESELRVVNPIYELFDSVNHVFYGTESVMLNGVDASRYAPSHSIYVVGLSYRAYGEEIKPSSFYLTIGENEIFDDGYGNLITSQSSTGSYVGNVFYDKGIAVVKHNASSVTESISASGMKIVSGSSTTVQFDSTVTIYEHTIVSKIFPGEYNISLFNPSARYGNVSSGSVSGTDRPIELMVSASLKPYITTIGYYNDNNELLVVAKLSTPTRRTFETTQTIIAKFDT